jgi:hypothetical protein
VCVTPATASSISALSPRGNGRDPLARGRVDHGNLLLDLRLTHWPPISGRFVPEAKAGLGVAWRAAKPIGSLLSGAIW